MTRTYENNHKDGSCEAPDERVVYREPAEIWISITLRIEANRQTYTQTNESFFKHQNVCKVVLQVLLLVNCSEI